MADERDMSALWDCISSLCQAYPIIFIKLLIRRTSPTWTITPEIYEKYKYKGHPHQRLDIIQEYYLPLASGLLFSSSTVLHVTRSFN